MRRPGSLTSMRPIKRQGRRGLTGRVRHVGQGGGGGGGTPEWLPEGAIVFAHFVNGHYYANGAECGLTDVFEENLDWGSWDGTVGEEGLTGGAPALKSVVAASLLGGATVLLDVRIPGVSGGSASFTDFSTYDPEYNVVWDATMAVVSAYPANVGFGEGVPGTGDHRIAATITPEKLAISLDGGSVDGDAVTPMGNFANIGLSPSSTGVIRRFVAFVPRLDADLPALSAL